MNSSEKSSKKKVLVIVIVLVAVIAAAAFAYNRFLPGASNYTSLNGQKSTDTHFDDNESAEGLSPAEDFSMISMDGRELALSNLQGKPVVLNFWASTCGPCKREMPEFQSAYEEYGDRVDFVMLNVPNFNGETNEDALALIQNSGYTFPVYFQIGEEASIKYGVTSIPRTYFITAEGTIATYAFGSISKEALTNGIEMILE